MKSFQSFRRPIGFFGMIFFVVGSFPLSGGTINLRNVPGTNLPKTACIVTLISPVKNAVLEQRRLPGGKVESVYSFLWSPCQGATKYHLYVIGPNALNPIINIDNINTTSYLSKDIHYGITHLKGWTWKVRAYVAGSWGEWSETRVFDVSPLAEPPQSCTISGYIKGNLQWDGTDDVGQRFHVKVEYVLLDADGNTLRAKIDRQRRYSFTNVPAGRTYKLYPGIFRSNPPYITVSCNGNTTHRGRDFTITGVKPD